MQKVYFQTYLPTSGNNDDDDILTSTTRGEKEEEKEFRITGIRTRTYVRAAGIEAERHLTELVEKRDTKG